MLCRPLKAFLKSDSTVNNMKDKTIYALGFFDGVHLGHQALLAQCRRMAEDFGCQAAALTFDLPPAALLTHQKPNMLTTTRDREALLRHFGMDFVYTYAVTEESLRLSWQDFLTLLLEQGAAGFVCGDDFRFGRNGEGNARKLTAFAAEHNLPCAVIEEQSMDGQRISSSRIRNLLEQGAVEQANRLLGHPHILSGTVVAGRKLGRTIGIPTANLQLPPELLTPAFGVYACKAHTDMGTFLAVANIGTRPTVQGNHITVEPWLLDFSGDLYGKTLSLAFYKYLRPEQKFPTLQALQEKIRENEEQTRKFFEKK